MSRRVDPDERERKRLHILEVAAGEFAQRGFDGANINTISERAGFGKGTVYLYAASKEQLFLDVIAEIGVQTQSAVRESLSQSVGASAQARLRSLAQAFTRLADEHPDFVRLQASSLFGVNRRFQDAAAAMLREVVVELSHSFGDDIAAGHMRRVTPDGLAVLLLGVLQTFALLPDVLGIAATDAQARVATIVDLLWRGLEPVGVALAGT